MSVLIETTLGDLVVDLFIQKAPTISFNFIKLAKIKHYHQALFSTVIKGYLASCVTHKPTTIFYQVSHERRFIADQLHEQSSRAGPHLNDSQFFITLGDRQYEGLLDKHTAFGEVVEGLEVLEKINKIHVDSENKPIVNLRIKRVVVLVDQTEDLPGMPCRKSPDRKTESKRLEAHDIKKIAPLDEKVAAKAVREERAKGQQLVLELLEDKPDADVKPQSNVLYVCKLNSCTAEKDLQLIFSRFGIVRNVEVARDWMTGKSLQYAFIEFETEQACNEAYLAMDNVIIDDRRIHVDFGQGHKKGWRQKQLPANRSKPVRGPEVVVKQTSGRQFGGKRYDLLFERRERSRER